MRLIYEEDEEYTEESRFEDKVVVFRGILFYDDGVEDGFEAPQAWEPVASCTSTSS